jgi:hypothetical protein
MHSWSCLASKAKTILAVATRLDERRGSFSSLPRSARADARTRTGGALHYGVETSAPHISAWATEATAGTA